MNNNKSHSLKSISDLIKAPMLTIIVAAFSIIALVCVVVEYISIEKIVRHTIESESAISTDRIEWAITSYKNIAEDIGALVRLSDPKVSVRSKQELLETKSDKYGLIRCKTINADGYSDMDGEYRGDREYFKHAMAGETYISDPIIAKTDGKLTLIVAAPIWEGGIYGSKVKGVVFCSIDPKLLSDIVSKIHMTKNTSVRVINSKGTIVASQNLDEVKNQINFIERAESDIYYKKEADIDRIAISGEKGVFVERNGLRTDMYAISEIQGTPGWKLVIERPINDHMDQFWISMGLLLVIILLLCIVINRRSEKIADKVGAPFKEIADRLKKAAEGDLSTEVLTFGDTEETKTISLAARDLVKRLEFMIMDNDEFSSSIALQDLIDRKTLNTFQDMLKASTGLGVIVINDQGEIVSTPADNCEFCSMYVKKSEIGAERCEKCDKEGSSQCIEKGQCIFYECHMGFREYAAPIMLEGHYVGAILGGQIRMNKDLDEEFLLRKAEEFDLDKEGFVRTASEMKVWTQEEVDKVESVLNTTAKFLSDMVQKAYRQNVKNRKQEKSAVLKSVKGGINENKISSLVQGMSGLDAMNLLNPDAGKVAKYLSAHEEDEHLSETSYDVRAVVNDAIGDMKLRTRGKSIDFLLDIKDELPQKLMGDQEKVADIVSRMIQTAIGATDSGYIRTDVTGIKSGYALYLKVKVRYSGGNKEAIDAAGMRKFVDRKNSFSVHNHSAQEIALITLGNVIKELDGQIDIKENKGHGITMCVVIPQLEELEEK